MTDSSFHIDETLFDNQDSIDVRLADVPEADRAAVGMILRYLYNADGPVSIARDQKAPGEQHLTPVEQFVFSWLYKRTDGKLRRLYGSAVLGAAKRARYRCEQCGFADVRALNLEKQVVDEETRFLCLCANCNTVASRAKEMAMVDASKERTEEV